MGSKHLTTYFFLFVRAVPGAFGSSQVGIKSELQLSAYTTATATGDPSRICSLRRSSRQRQILNPLSKTRDQTCIRIYF